MNSADIRMCPRSGAPSPLRLAHDDPSPHGTRCATAGRLCFGAAAAAGDAVIVLPRSERGMRRLFRVLLLAATVLVAVGFIAGTLWLLVAGAWVLIAALLIELIYRP